MQELIPLISEVGFPIVVTLYLLHRIEAKLDNVVQSIQNLPNQMKENEYSQRKFM
ncbi:MAG: YvrJ family protein [Bacillota bacterium]